MKPKPAQLAVKAVEPTKTNEQPKPLAHIEPEAFVTLKKRDWAKIRSLARMRKQAVADLALLAAGLDFMTEECNQLVGFNSMLRIEGQKVVALCIALQTENKMLKDENAALKPRSPPDPVQPIVGPCRNCPHDDIWHHNPSRICTRENCPCMAWAPKATPAPLEAAKSK